MSATATRPPEGREAAALGHSFDRSNLPLLLTLALGVFAGALDLGVLSPALPALARDLHVAPRDVAWVFTLYLFANIVSIPIMTKLSDVFGRRWIYVACLSIFALGSIGAIAAPSFALFLAARAVQAIGAGGIFPVATAAIADRVPVERRGSALGLLGAVWGLAAILGPNLGGIVTHFVGWHWIFIANVPLAIGVSIAAMRTVPQVAAHRRGPLDVAGILALSIGLLGIMFGLTRFDPRSASIAAGAIPTPAFVAGALALSVAAFLVLARIERVAPEPIMAPRLFATRQLVVTYGLEVLVGLLEGSLFFIPAALVAADHLSAAAAGALAAIGAVMFVAIIPLAGRGLDAFGSRAVLLVGTALTALGLALLTATLQNVPLAAVSIAIAGVGFGALLGAPTRYIITNEVPPEIRGSGVGLLSIFLILGQIVGGSLAGGIIGIDMGDVAGYRAAFATFAAVAVLAALVTLSLASRQTERTAPR